MGAAAFADRAARSLRSRTVEYRPHKVFAKLDIKSADHTCGQPVRTGVPELLSTEGADLLADR